MLKSKTRLGSKVVARLPSTLSHPAAVIELVPSEIPPVHPGGPLRSNPVKSIITSSTPCVARDLAVAFPLNMYKYMYFTPSGFYTSFNNQRVREAVLIFQTPAMYDLRELRYSGSCVYILGSHPKDLCVRVGVLHGAVTPGG